MSQNSLESTCTCACVCQKCFRVNFPKKKYTFFIENLWWLLLFVVLLLSLAVRKPASEWCEMHIINSSHLQVLYKIVILTEILQNWQENNCDGFLLSNKLQVGYKNKTPLKVFSCEFGEIFQSSYSIEHL